MTEPPSPLAQAFAAYQSGDLEKAKRLGMEVSRREPNNLQALHLLSLVASASGDREGHVDLLNRILALAPNHPPSLVALANVRLTEGNPGEAAKLALRAIARDPNYAGAYNTLGLCLQSEGKHSEAVERFQQALLLNPNAAALHVNVGASLYQLGRWHDALAAYRQAESLSPNIPEIYDGLGRVYGAQKKRIEAISNFEKALSITPSSATRMLQLADAQAMVGETEASLTLVLGALQAEPGLAEAHYLHGLRLQEQGRYDEATAAFEKSLELKPDQGGAYLGLTTNRRLSERDQPLIGRMQSLADAKELPADQLVLLHTALGKAYDDVAEHEKAIANIDEANRLERLRAGASLFDPQDFRRYVARLMSTFSSEFFEARRDWSLDSDLPIFIVGLPRSGTTLAEGILSSHPDVEAAGEQVFWTEADRNESIALLGDHRERSLELGRAYLKALRKFGPDARFVTDKRPDNFLFLGLLHVLFPSARIVHCTRDPIDNAASLYMTPYRTRPAFAQTREGIVTYVEQYRLLMGHWARVLASGSVFDVRYEELVSDQEAVTRELLSFCGLPWNERCLRPEESRRSVATPSNWQARQSVYGSSVDRWKPYKPFLGPITDLGK